MSAATPFIASDAITAVPLKGKTLEITNPIYTIPVTEPSTEYVPPHIIRLRSAQELFMQRMQEELTIIGDKFDPTSAKQDATALTMYIGGLLEVFVSQYSLEYYDELLYIYFVCPLAARYNRAHNITTMMHQMRNKLQKLYKDQLKKIEKSYTVDNMRHIAKTITEHFVHDIVITPYVLRRMYKVMYYAAEYGVDYFVIILELLQALDATTAFQVRNAVMVMVAQLKAGVDADEINYDPNYVSMLHQLQTKYLSAEMDMLCRRTAAQCEDDCHQWLALLATSDNSQATVEACHLWLQDNIVKCPAGATALVVLYQVLLHMNPCSSIVGVLAEDHSCLTLALDMPAVIQAWAVVRTYKCNETFLKCLLRMVLKMLDTSRVTELEACVTDMVLELGRVVVNKADPDFLPQIKTWVGSREAVNLRAVL